MSNSNADNRNNEGAADQHGGWQPTAQGGEYDAEATAFVQLPPEDLANIPLAAPGQGYVPPMIVPLTPAAGLDPAATGSWVVQTQSTQDQEPEQQATGAVHWPDPNEQQHQQHQQLPEYPQHEQYPQQGETSASTGQWNFAEATAAETSGHTGQWTIPVADGDLPEESGEFAASAPASQWYADRTPPATLPGGAPAPWATQPEAPEVSGTAAEGAADTPASGTDITQVPAPDATAAETAEPPAEPVADTTDAPEQALPTDDPPHDTTFDTPPDTPLDTPSEHPSASYVLHVNGADRPVTDAWIGESLLYVLRERLGLAGAKDGCSQGECGACNVQVDGRLVASCLVPAATAEGSEVRTVEGLAVDGEPSDVQRALADCGAVQCGFCIPGMAMTIHDLLEGNHAPSELETRQALCGNLCRCSGYRGVLDAVNEVIAGREASTEAAREPGAATADAHSTEARIPHQAAPGAGSVQPHLQDGGMA
ncbi:2Fe-2S iron-sulfur cluster-binding protein [Streptomyces sp. NBC_01669]|uniref:2Fe-2S iron-sulfur cluster-binding protein n=1 Tax=Streptomyces sp. NBC_01669 TaxID=2975909 RepID=UPI0022509BA0|nr:2Fe-2S iron-sulfur cluster-binding protein [Streptomyces sp. NBC_01669]MCX4534798.1 2Fe-2S iron-sulfur cluster-binding protein [Streptomyces sp. NBC_01669]